MRGEQKKYGVIFKSSVQFFFTQRFMMMLAAIFFVYVITYMPGFLVKTVSAALVLEHMKLKIFEVSHVLRLTGATPTPPFTQSPTSSTGPQSGSTQSFTSPHKRNTRSVILAIFPLPASLDLQDALRHLLPCFKSNRRTSVRTTKMKSFNLDSTDTTNSDSRRNTAAVDDSVVGVETRDKGSPSLVVK